MKKWLLISSFINISMLLVPFSFEIDKKEIIEKIKVGNIIFEEERNLQKEIISSSRNNTLEVTKEGATRESNKISTQEEVLVVTEENSSEKVTDTVTLVEDSNEIKKIIAEEETQVINHVVEKKIVEETSGKSEEKIDSIIEPKEIIAVSSGGNSNSYANNQSNVESDIKEVDNNILVNGLVKENSELNYKIIKMPKPDYPTKARNLSFYKKITITSEFIVGKDGKVREISLKSENDYYKKYDFDKSVEKVLKEYTFTPISYRGKIVEVKFIKDFEFN